MLAIDFQKVCKNYRQQSVLKQISFQIKIGEFFGLVGVNGVGKTTLLKSTLDFCNINQGNIHILGITHTSSQARQPIAFLPEQFTPPHYMTGKDFLMYMAELYGYKYDEDKVRAIFQVLDVNLNALKQSVGNYSKGMAQKLGLAACFLSNKPILILDEPMTGLDPKVRIYLKRYLLSLKQQRVTLFFSTHLLVDVEILCDRMAILHEGHVRFVGTPAECCTQFMAPTLEQAYLRCIE